MSDVDINLPGGKTLSLHFDGDPPAPEVLDQIVSQHIREIKQSGSGSSPPQPQKTTVAPASSTRPVTGSSPAMGYANGIGYRMRPVTAQAAFNAGTDAPDPNDPFATSQPPRLSRRPVQTATTVVPKPGSSLAAPDSNVLQRAAAAIRAGQSPAQFFASELTPAGTALKQAMVTAGEGALDPTTAVIASRLGRPQDAASLLAPVNAPTLSNPTGRPGGVGYDPTKSVISRPYAYGRGVGEGMAPAAGGVAGAAYGARAAEGLLFTLFPGLAEFPLAHLAATLGGGALGAAGGSGVISKADQAILNALLTPEARQALAEQNAAIQQQQPGAYDLGQLTAQGAYVKPNLSLDKEAMLSRVAGGAMAGAFDVGAQAQSGQEFDPVRLLRQTAGGALLSGETTGVGDVPHGAGEAAVHPALKTAAQTAADKMASKAATAATSKPSAPPISPETQARVDALKATVGAAVTHAQDGTVHRVAGVTVDPDTGQPSIYLKDAANPKRPGVHVSPEELTTIYQPHTPAPHPPPSIAPPPPPSKPKAPTTATTTTTTTTADVPPAEVTPPPAPETTHAAQTPETTTPVIPPAVATPAAEPAAPPVPDRPTGPMTGAQRVAAAQARDAAEAASAPWGKTLDQFIAENGGPGQDKETLSDLRFEHYSAVSSALVRGKPVPPEVVKGYPDLAAEFSDEMGEHEKEQTSIEEGQGGAKFTPTPVKPQQVQSPPPPTAAASIPAKATPAEAGQPTPSPYDMESANVPAPNAEPTRANPGVPHEVPEAGRQITTAQEAGRSSSEAVATPQADSTKTSTSAKPAAQANYPNEANLSRVGVGEDEIARIKAEAAKHGLDASKSIPHENTQQAARNLGVTVDELRHTALGQKRENANTTDWNEAIRQLAESHAIAAKNAEAAYKAAPDGPEKETAFQGLLKANEDLAVAIAHDQRNAAESGRSLGARGKPTGGTPVRGALAGSTTDDLIYPPGGGPAPKSEEASVPGKTGRSRRTPATPKSESWGKANKLVSKDAYEEARARFRQNAGKLHAGLDPDLLKDAVIMGSFHIEAGLREFPSWAAQMRQELGGQATEGHLQTIWAAARAEIAGGAQRAGAAPGSSTVFADQLARKMGSREAASSFIEEINERGGGQSGTDLFDKLLTSGGDMRRLTPHEQAIIATAMEGNQRRTTPPGAPQGAMKVLADIRAEAINQKRQARRPLSPQGAGVGTVAGGGRISPPPPRAPKGPPTPEEIFGSSLNARYGKKGADAWRAAVGPDVVRKMLTGQSLTDAETASVVAAHQANQRAANAARPNPGGKALTEILSDARKAADQAKRAQAAANRTDTDHFMQAAARRLGGEKRASAWRAQIGEDVLGKLVRGEDLTPEEADKAGRAFVGTQRPATRTVRQVAENVKTLGDLVKATKKQIEHERVASLSPKELVRESLLSQIPTDDNGLPKDQERVATITKGLADIDDHDTRRLNNFLSQQATDMFQNYQSYLRAGALSGTSTIGKIGLSHLVAALAREAERPMAALGDTTMGKILGTQNRSTTGFSGESVGHSVQEMGRALPEAGTILAKGDNALTMEGKNRFHEPGKPLQPEFTVPNKVGGAVINPVIRAPMRVHGALYHIANEGHYDRGLTEWAQVAAMNEATAKNLRGAARDSFVKSRMAENLKNPTPEGLEYATQHKDVMMYTNPNKIAQKIASATREEKNNPTLGEKVGGAAATNLLLFTKVPTNIGGKAIEYTGGPVTSAYALSRALFSRLHGEYRPQNGKSVRVPFKDLPAAEQMRLQKIWAETFARGGFGTGALIAGYAAQKAGIINAPDQKKFERGSVNVAGRKYGIGGIEPISAPVLAGATIAEKGLSADTAHEIGGEIVQNNPYVRASEVVDALRSTNPKDARALVRAGGGLLAQQSPLHVLVNEIAASTDPTHSMRQKSSPLDYVLSRIFGLRETLPVAMDNQGRPIPEQGGLFHALPSAPIQPQTGVDHLFEILDNLNKTIDDFRANPHPTAEEMMKARMAMSVKARLIGPGGPLYPILGSSMMRHYIKGQQGQQSPPTSSGQKQGQGAAR